jgi:transposase
MIAKLDAQVEEMMQPFRAQRDLLITIPGIGRLSIFPCKRGDVVSFL